jgi:hypothetical protein
MRPMQQILGDVLITEPCCKSLTRRQAETQGSAATRGEAFRRSKYGEPASQGGQVFSPFALHRTMAEGILARVGRLNSGPFRDESSWERVIQSQSFQR